MTKTKYAKIQLLVTFDIMLKYRPYNEKLHIQSLIQVIQTGGQEVNYKNNDLGPLHPQLFRQI